MEKSVALLKTSQKRPIISIYGFETYISLLNFPGAFHGNTGTRGGNPVVKISTERERECLPHVKHKRDRNGTSVEIMGRDGIPNV